VPIPEAWLGEFWPAQGAIYEWTPLRFRCRGADQLRVGQRFLPPLVDDVWLLRIENQLGLLELQPFAKGQPLEAPSWFEVLSPKFPGFAGHRDFLEALCHELLLHSAQLPFGIDNDTARGVQSTLEATPPLLWALEWLHRHENSLREVCATILARPQRGLQRQNTLQPIAAASHADADTLLDVMQNPQRWQPNRSLPLSRHLGGHAPLQVRQNRNVQTFDVPANRWVWHHLNGWREMTHRLTQQNWWLRVNAQRRESVRRVRESLQSTLQHAMWEDIETAPQPKVLWSREILRHPGYRELWQLWESYQSSPQPLWARWQTALQLRDVARLYEMWCFFALAERLGEELQTAPQFKTEISQAVGLQSYATASFGKHGTLVYNALSDSYSMPLRPDFTWRVKGRARIVFDAKFRLENTDGNAAASPIDLVKMHAYRDALGVRAALTLYPGNSSLLYGVDGAQPSASLRQIITGDWQGIGALAFLPQQVSP
jgi:predicted component of viral defense system (DUF524 family)